MRKKREIKNTKDVESFLKRLGNKEFVYFFEQDSMDQDDYDFMFSLCLKLGYYECAKTLKALITHPLFTFDNLEALIKASINKRITSSGYYFCYQFCSHFTILRLCLLLQKQLVKDNIVRFEQLLSTDFKISRHSETRNWLSDSYYKYLCTYMSCLKENKKIPTTTIYKRPKELLQQLKSDYNQIQTLLSTNEGKLLGITSPNETLRDLSKMTFTKEKMNGSLRESD